MKGKVIKTLLTGFLLSGALCSSVFAASADADFDFAGNCFLGGNSAELSEAEASDVFASGNHLVIEDSQIKGDIFAAAKSIRAEDSQVGNDVFAVAEDLNLEDMDIEGNLFAVSEYISFDAKSQAAAVSMCGNSVDFEGSTLTAKIVGDKIYFNGYVKGDLYISGRDVVFGDDAVVEGTATVSSESIDMADGALVSDLYYDIISEDTQQTVKNEARMLSGFVKAVKKVTSRIYWIPAMLLLTVLLCWLFNANLNEAADMIKSNSGEMVLWGALCWCLIPVACVILALTFIGLPVAAMIAAVYVVLLCAGLTFAGASLGRLTFKKLHPMLASVIGVAILECVKIIPFIGALVGVAADMYLLGYAAKKIYTQRGDIKG